MAYALVTTTAATAMPVDAARVRAHARIETSQEDDVLDTLIARAVSWIEEHTGMRLAPQVVTEYVDVLPDSDTLVLHVHPITSIVVTYDDVDDAAQTWSSANYWTHLGRKPALLQAKTVWPTTYSGKRGAFRVAMTCGYAAGAVPPAVLGAIDLLVGHWYEHREHAADMALREAPMAAQALLAPFRLFGGA